VLRGVVNGTLERVLIEHLAASDQPVDVAWLPVVSTSSLFERAEASTATTTVLLPGKAKPAEDVPADAKARIQTALDAGYAVLVPKAPLDVDGTPRFAWWQVEPATGSTIAVTDEGLHQATVEMSVIRGNDGKSYVITDVGGKTVRVSRFGSYRDAVRFTELMEERLGSSLVVETRGATAWWLL